MKTRKYLYSKTSSGIFSVELFLPDWQEKQKGQPRKAVLFL
jgi:hypothetical protein